MTDRNVQQISPSPEGGEERQPQPFSAFAQRSNIVLLGDPGAGKSHLFRESAAASDGRCLTARAFLNIPAFPPDAILFIDGLDERRAGRGDRGTVDAIVQKLFAAAPAKVRISCRVVDWLGKSDLAAFQPYFEQNGGAVVLCLERLSPEEQRAVLAAQAMTAADADTFIQEAKGRGLTEFLENPRNLIMLVQAVKTGSWPATRNELFMLSTRLLLSEPSDEHSRVGSGVYTVDELRDAAGAICAARLISDVAGISLLDREGEADIPSYRSLGFLNVAKAQAVLGRRAFEAGPVPESVDYAHRTTAEFLGAEWLAARVRAGLPLGRVQALMGVDGHPASELRGLHAWLARFLPEQADRLVDADPYGILTYGDAGALSPTSRRRLLDALGRLSASDPWFRGGQWRSPGIGALAQPDGRGVSRRAQLALGKLRLALGCRRCAGRRYAATGHEGRLGDCGNAPGIAFRGTDGRRVGAAPARPLWKGCGLRNLSRAPP
jgi:predicted NACHT family NTPase